MEIECNGMTAVVTFPRVVPVLCNYCREQIGVKEVGDWFTEKVDYGVCDSCGLEQLPPECHAEWLARNRETAVAGMEQVGSKWGEQLYQEVVS